MMSVEAPEFGLFISDIAARRLVNPRGVACVFSKRVLLDVIPGCQPITLEQAWRDAGLRGEPWVVVRSAPVHDETMVFLNEALFVFTTASAAADHAAHMNVLGGRGSNWLARTLREHLAQISTKVKRAAALYDLAGAACEALIAALPAPTSEVRNAS